jgi:recombination protein RecT
VSETIQKQGSNLPARPLDTLRGMLEKAAPKFAEVAPKYMKVERLVRLVLSNASRNPKVLECTPDSVLLFCMRCSESGFDVIGAGGAWAVPYWNSKIGKMELQYIPDYRGLVNAAKRADCIKDAYAEVVRENDEFDYSLGLDPTLTHRPARGERGELECAYCVMVFPDDTKRFVVMDAGEINGIRSRSKARDGGPWVTDEAEMWKKTVVRRAMKPFAGASPELDAAIEYDNEATGLVDVQAAVSRQPIQPTREALPDSTPAPEATSAAPEPSTQSATPTPPPAAEEASGKKRGRQPKDKEQEPEKEDDLDLSSPPSSCPAPEKVIPLMDAGKLKVYVTEFGKRGVTQADMEAALSVKMDDGTWIPKPAAEWNIEDAEWLKAEFAPMHKASDNKAKLAEVVGRFKVRRRNC